MCQNCGCGHVESFTVIPMENGPESAGHGGHEHQHQGHFHTHEHDGVVHSHKHDHDHPHAHPHSPGEHGAHTVVPVHLPLLEKNDRLAEQNRGYLRAKGVFAVNIVSSPGSGKTTLVAKTLEQTAGTLPAAVIVGDLETTNDAVRLRDKGAPVVQVTTGTVCHLDAAMVAHGLDHLDLTGRRLLIIENVGNLVCPASYDLGEALRVVLISVTEGEDKPLKYPPIFCGAGIVVINKIDMLAASGINLELLQQNIRAVAPGAEIITLSARTGEGMDQWLTLLKEKSRR